MGNSHPNQIKAGRGMIDVSKVEHLRFLEDGQFAKVYKGNLITTQSSFGLGSTHSSYNGQPNGNAINSDAKQIVSIKVPRVSDAIRKEKKQVKLHIEEVRKLMPLTKRSGLSKSAYLVKYFGVAYDDFRKEVWVVREYIDGLDLETLMKNPSLCPSLRSPEKKMAVSVGIARGMSYLHSLRTPTIHGDFKPSDVLIPATDLLTPKIANFGLWDFKKYFVENTLPEQAYPSIMTNPWQAPEVLLGQERPTIFADIWSVAATLLQWLTEQSNPWDMQDLCTRYKMRHNREMAALMKAMENQEEPSVLTLLTDFDTENHGLNVMRIALNYRPTERPPVRKIEEELEIASRTPTWTNLAYQKYYGK